MPDLKLGKKPATEDKRDFKFAELVHFPNLPSIPANFGPKNLIGKIDWGMLGNDEYGDCVWAGAAHEHLLWNAEAGKEVKFTPDAVLSDYAAVTGFNPSNPNSDQGTDMRQAMEYRRTTGVVDASGHRHKIAAYVTLEPGNWDHLVAATYLFDATAVGIQFPSYAMDQFARGQVWTARKNEQIEGGHYIPVIAVKDHHPICITWGREQPMTRHFYEKHCDEAFVPLTEEFLKSGISPDGFDMEKLNSMLEALKS